MSPFLLSIVVIAVFALAWGGVVAVRGGRERRRGVLMLVAAAVLLANLAILAWPMGSR